MRKITRLNRRENVQSFAPEHAWQPRGASNEPTFIPVGLSANQRLLERLEAENAQLRHRVAKLRLEIQALREAVGHQQSET
jgi:hypothetical protein